MRLNLSQLDEKQRKYLLFGGVAVAAVLLGGAGVSAAKKTPAKLPSSGGLDPLPKDLEPVPDNFKSSTTPPDSSNLAAVIKWFAGFAQDAARKSGLPASVIIAQAILESGWGKSALSQKANAYLGITARPSTTYPRFRYWDGVTITMSNGYTYRKYSHPWYSFMNYAEMIYASGYYGTAIAAWIQYHKAPAIGINKYIDALAGIYEPANPDYARQLKKLIADYRIEEQYGILPQWMTLDAELLGNYAQSWRGQGYKVS